MSDSRNTEKTPDGLRGHLADRPLIREDLLTRIETLRVAAAPVDEIEELIDVYRSVTRREGR